MTNDEMKDAIIREATRGLSELKAKNAQLQVLLDEHRRFHDKAACPMAPDCRVCCAEAAYAIQQEVA